jgi:histone H3/H4
MVRLLRDNIQGITNAAIQRLAYTAGITTMTGDSYEEIRGILKAKLEIVLRKIVTYLEYYRKITIDEYMVAASISPKMWSSEPKAKSCGIKRKNPSKVSRSRRKKKSAGYNALSQIKFYQRRSDCLNIPMLPFSRYAREVTQEYKIDVKFTKNAMILLQYSMEQYIIDILKKSLKNTIYSNRIRVEPKDINIAYKYVNNEF